MGSERYEHVLGMAHNMTFARIAEIDDPSEFKEHPCEQLLSLCTQNTPAKPKNTLANKNGGPEHVVRRYFEAEEHPCEAKEHRNAKKRCLLRKRTSCD